MRSRSTVAVVVAVLLAASAAAVTAGTVAVGRAAEPAAHAPRAIDPDLRNVQLTAIVITAPDFSNVSVGPQSRTKPIAGTVTLETPTGVFPVRVMPGHTVTIPFGSGWSVADDGLRIVIENGRGELGAKPEVWGTTTVGPVRLR